MASYPRNLILKDNSLFHVTWRCHNQNFHMKFDWVKKKYYELLLTYKDRYDVKIYSYCFMSNHPHISGHCKTQTQLSDFFRLVNSQIARFYNRRMKRKGQLVMDRFKSPEVENNTALLKIMMYIDLNPNRARMVKHPKSYRWSSFHYYAYGKEDPLITPAPSYLELGSTNNERKKEYINLVETIIRHDWKNQATLYDKYFLGSPDWVTYRYNLIKKYQKLKREEKILSNKCKSKICPSIP